MARVPNTARVGVAVVVTPNLARVAVIANPASPQVVAMTVNPARVASQVKAPSRAPRTVALRGTARGTRLSRSKQGRSILSQFVTFEDRI